MQNPIRFCALGGNAGIRNVSIGLFAYLCPTPSLLSLLSSSLLSSRWLAWVLFLFSRVSPAPGFVAAGRCWLRACAPLLLCLVSSARVGHHLLVFCSLLSFFSSLFFSFFFLSFFFLSLFSCIAPSEFWGENGRKADA